MTTANIDLPIYMDYQATTPLDPRVLDAMMPFLTEKFGNPHSNTHKFGWEAMDAIDRARGQIAALIGAQAEEIVFTSGATESNNLAIKGLGRAYAEHRDHIVTIETEHKCVLESVASMEREGYSVTVLPVGPDGLIDMDKLSQSITDRTLLVSVMAVNNEIGVIQPLADIGALCRERKVFFHTDGAQAVGKIPLDVEAMKIDLMSLTGHKVYGPKGAGALYLRKKSRARPEPLLSGGGQEDGLRSGTLAPALCVGLGEACAIAEEEYEREAERLREFFDRFVAGVQSALPTVVLNGHREQRIPGNISLSFPGVRSDRLLASMRDLAVSSGSACVSESDESSYVLKAIGVTGELAEASIRFGIGRFTTSAEIDYAIDALITKVSELREAA